MISEPGQTSPMTVRERATSLKGLDLRHVVMLPSVYDASLTGPAFKTGSDAAATCRNTEDEAVVVAPWSRLSASALSRRARRVNSIVPHGERRLHRTQRQLGTPHEIEVALPSGST